MRSVKTLLLCAVTLGVPALAPAGPKPAVPVPAAGGGGGLPVCELSAHGLLLAARAGAEADVYRKVVIGLNDPGVNLGLCIQEAIAERQEAVALATDQRDARLDLCNVFGSGPYDPDIDPNAFSATVNNTYFPLVPGRILIYEKVTPEGLERVETTTLATTLEIDGVTCRVVHDIEMLDGALMEDTHDWFAQKSNGEVWYFGEIALNYEDGFLEDIDGSWRTGKDGAKPGIQMPGTPVVGARYRQEFLPGEAEDVAEVVAVGVTVTANNNVYTNCLKTLEWSPIEPDNQGEWKYYAPGIGLVLEVDVETGETLQLIQIIN